MALGVLAPAEFLLDHRALVEQVGLEGVGGDGFADRLDRLIAAVELHEQPDLRGPQGRGVDGLRLAAAPELGERFVGAAEVRECKRFADARLEREGAAPEFGEVLRGALGRLLDERGVAELQPGLEPREVDVLALFAQELDVARERALRRRRVIEIGGELTGVEGDPRVGDRPARRAREGFGREVAPAEAQVDAAEDEMGEGVVGMLPEEPFNERAGFLRVHRPADVRGRSEKLGVGGFFCGELSEPAGERAAAGRGEKLRVAEGDVGAPLGGGLRMGRDRVGERAEARTLSGGAVDRIEEPREPVVGLRVVRRAVRQKPGDLLADALAVVGGDGGGEEREARALGLRIELKPEARGLLGLRRVAIGDGRLPGELRDLGVALRAGGVKPCGACELRVAAVRGDSRCDELEERAVRMRDGGVGGRHGEGPPGEGRGEKKRKGEETEAALHGASCEFLRARLLRALHRLIVSAGGAARRGRSETVAKPLPGGAGRRGAP